MEIFVFSRAVPFKRLLLYYSISLPHTCTHTNTHTHSLSPAPGLPPPLPFSRTIPVPPLLSAPLPYLQSSGASARCAIPSSGKLRLFLRLGSLHGFSQRAAHGWGNGGKLARQGREKDWERRFVAVKRKRYPSLSHPKFFLLLCRCRR